MAVGNARQGQSSGSELKPWVRDLSNKVARSLRTTERDDLQAELAEKLLLLKRRSGAGIRDWKAYASKFLRNKASNWIRDRRARERKLVALESNKENGERTSDLMQVLPSDEQDPGLRIAFAQLWQELEPELRSVWERLAEEGGNQVKVARRLGMHRNTVRLRVREIRRLLERHGFQAPNVRISHNRVTLRLGAASGSLISPRVKRDFEALQKRRFRAMALLAKGLNKTVVSRRLRVARQTVSRWVMQYRESGKAGLAKAGSPGRKPFLNRVQRERLIGLLSGGPEVFGHETRRWTCPQVARLIKLEFGIVYHVGHVWKLLRRLSWKRKPSSGGRPQPKADAIRAKREN